MIGFISGTILESNDGKVLLAVQTGTPAAANARASRIGYLVNTPTAGVYSGLVVGEYAEFFVHTHVREDALDLIGFLTRVEKEIFLALLNVNGIGPKGALGILSKLEISTLVDAVLSENAGLLTEVPGIGKKTAERLVMELKDPLRKKVEAGLLSASGFATATAAAKTKATATGQLSLNLEIYREAREALVSLGYRDVEITAALKKVSDSGAKPESRRSEEVIKLALKELA